MSVSVCPYCGSPLSRGAIAAGRCDACEKKIDDDEGVTDAPARPARRGADDDDDDDDREANRRARRALAGFEADARIERARGKAVAGEVSTTLFVVAALQLVCGLSGVFLFGAVGGKDVLDRPDFLLLVGEVVLIGLAFVGLGIWAIWMPLPPAVLGLILYVGYNLLVIALNPEAIGSGLIMKALITLALARAVYAAVQGAWADR